VGHQVTAVLQKKTDTRSGGHWRPPFRQVFAGHIISQHLIYRFCVLQVERFYGRCCAAKDGEFQWELSKSSKLSVVLASHFTLTKPADNSLQPRQRRKRKQPTANRQTSRRETERNATVSPWHYNERDDENIGLLTGTWASDVAGTLARTGPSDVIDYLGA
jgi:hypothetical protein